MLFYFYAPAKFAPANGTKRRKSAHLRCFGAQAPPLATRHAPAKFAPANGTKRKGSAYIGSFGALATL